MMCLYHPVSILLTIVLLTATEQNTVVIAATCPSLDASLIIKAWVMHCSLLPLVKYSENHGIHKCLWTCQSIMSEW